MLKTYSVRARIYDEKGDYATVTTTVDLVETARVAGQKAVARLEHFARGARVELLQVEEV